MAFARDRYTATAGQTDFVVSFTPMETDHIEVEVNGVAKTITTDYTFPSTSLLRFNSGLTAGDAVLINRNSSQDERIVDYSVPGTLTETDLDNDSQQAFNMAQEAIDIANESMVRDSSNNWEGSSVRIANVDDPVNAQDVVTKAYGDANYGGTAVDRAETAQAAAEAAETAAETAQTAAEAAQTAAELVQSNLELPTAVADTYLRRNAGNTAYVAKAPEVVLGDVISSATEDTAPDSGADFVGTYDASAEGGKKTLLKNAGRIVQVVDFQTGAVATGTTLIPNDNTIPQNTEGDQYMELAITPKSATNKLRIDVTVQLTHSAAGTLMAVGLFQDDTVNALATMPMEKSDASGPAAITFSYIKTAGMTGETTFKIRAGGHQAGTTTFNGAGGTGLYGGTIASSIIITEYVP